MSKTRLEKYGPWAIVTGASSGIGAACALQLASEGFHLILVARRRDQLEEISKKARDQFSVKTEIISADLATEEGIALVRTNSMGKDIGLYIASAGFGMSGPFLDSDLKLETAMLAVNCLSLMQLTYEFGNRMKQRGSGGIILISSLLGWQGVPGSANYAATKAYVQSLAEGLASEMRELGIDVLASAPGPVLTEFGERAHMDLTSGATPQEVAFDSLDALGRKSTVIPGTLSKIMTWPLLLLPRPYRVKMMKRIMSGLTEKK